MIYNSPLKFSLLLVDHFFKLVEKYCEFMFLVVQFVSKAFTLSLALVVNCEGGSPRPALCLIYRSKPSLTVDFLYNKKHFMKEFTGPPSLAPNAFHFRVRDRNPCWSFAASIKPSRYCAPDCFPKISFAAHFHLCPSLESLT